ncbi:histone-fold-containing protein [Peniophora sp. CONT]|nr:histone-fold-containing protein [Peniophora sp. CONT]
MPPRANTNASASTSTLPSDAAAQQKQVTAELGGIEQYELPRAVVTKLARAAVPDGTKMQRDTVTALMKGSTVFINYLAAVAQDVAHQKQHKTVSAADVLRALELIDFADVAGPLQEELDAYRSNQRKSSSAAPASKPKVGKPKQPAAATKDMSVDAEMADAAGLNDDDETGTSERGRSESSGA